MIQKIRCDCDAPPAMICKRCLKAVEKENDALKEKLERIKSLVNIIQRNHNWYVQRGGLLPYDWPEYMGKNLYELEKVVNSKKKGVK